MNKKTWVSFGLLGALAAVTACGACGGASESGRGVATNAGIGADPNLAAASPGSSAVSGGEGGGGAGALLDWARTTKWNPGILFDGQLHKPLGADGLPVRDTICASPAPGADLNAAISACADGKVVQLAAGTYTVSSTVDLTKGVVLRGAGSQGAGSGGTTIVKTGGGPVLSIGGTQDRGCNAGGYGPAVALTHDAIKETTTVEVGSAASGFSAGDFAIIDEVDDMTVQEGDCNYFKRVDKRSTGERVEITSVSGGALTLSSPLHWTFRAAAPYSAQIAKVTLPVVKWAGIEHLAIQGGTNPGYPGQTAGGIDIADAAYSWVKDVQTDGTIGGMHVAMTGTFRVVVRDSDFHNSAKYGFGADCYGIVLRCSAADNLVENNVARFMNKPILFNVSGGGNVVAYNYADNSWATPPTWQEINVDTHCAFPHMELVESNYAPHMGATITHGNAGYMTFFRNYSSGQFASPAVWGSTDRQDNNIAALQFDSGDYKMTVIGNVLGSSSANDLGTAPVSAEYTISMPGKPGIFEVGDGPKHSGTGDVAWTSLWWTGNFDTVSKKVVWNPAIAAHTMPASLYLKAKPAWWPAGAAWPWAGSDLTPMVGTLPAKARSEKLGH
jgi:hypothetical protein